MADPFESYSPINASSGSGRPGGDQIAISFSPGKKSTKEQLDELAIQKAKLDIAQLQLIPVGSEQQRYSWEAENQRLAQESAARSATQAAIDIQQRQLALQQSAAMNPLSLQAQQISSLSALSEEQRRQALAPVELASQKSSLQSQELSRQQAAQQIAQANITNPLDVQARQQQMKQTEAQMKQSGITNPLDVQAKQLGITGAQQEINKAKQDEAYRNQAYKESHYGMTPEQYNSSFALNQRRQAATNYAPIGSAADTAYMKTVMPGYGKPYTAPPSSTGVMKITDLSQRIPGRPYVIVPR